MALSNIFREPRREITESVVGIAVFGAIAAPVAFADYAFAAWLYEMSGGERSGCPIVIGMVLGIMVFVILGGITLLFALLTHSIGESMCAALDRRGLRLRPINRPSQR